MGCVVLPSVAVALACALGIVLATIRCCCCRSSTSGTQEEEAPLREGANTTDMDGGCLRRWTDADATLLSMCACHFTAYFGFAVVIVDSHGLAHRGMRPGYLVPDVLTSPATCGPSPSASRWQRWRLRPSSPSAHFLCLPADLASELGRDTASSGFLVGSYMFGSVVACSLSPRQFPLAVLHGARHSAPLAPSSPL